MAKKTILDGGSWQPGLLYTNVKKFGLKTVDLALPTGKKAEGIK
jgi:hypothetical protein